MTQKARQYSVISRRARWSEPKRKRDNLCVRKSKRARRELRAANQHNCFHQGFFGSIFDFHDFFFFDFFSFFLV